MAFYAQQRNIENPKETKSAIHCENKKNFFTISKETIFENYFGQCQEQH